MTWQDVLQVVLYTAVSYKCFFLIREGLKDGLLNSSTLDFFGLNLFSQVLSLFSYYGLYLYLLVPLFVCYKGLSWLNMLFGMRNAFTPSEQPQLDEKELKRQAKKERKEKRVKYI